VKFLFNNPFAGDVIHMRFFDFQTIVISSLISNIIITLVMAYVWSQNRKRFAGTSRWFIYHILFTLAILLTLFRGKIEPLIASVFSELLMICGLMFFYIGLQRFIGKAAAYFRVTVYFLVYVFVSYFFTIVISSIKVRIIIFSLYFIVIGIQSIYLLLFQTEKDKRIIYRNTAIACALMVILNICRIITVLTNTHVVGFIISAPVDSIIMLSSQMINIAMTFSLVLMINSKLFMGIQEFANEKEALVLELRKLANTDGLTGVFNRSKIEQILTTEVLRSRRYKHPLSVILADIDHFKTVNDTYGHNVGDVVLTGIASLMKQHVREVDTVGRWGGEEFLIVCPDTTSDGAKKLAEKLRKKIEKHNFKDVGSKTISMGIAQIEKDDWDEDMIKRADKNLYRAKKSGRNRVE
jgi:diguanylate cyclase (GGDEF)-like protein